MSGYEAFSATPASNTTVDGSAATDIAENNSPKTINNAVRALVAEFAKLRDLIGGTKLSAGTADAQTLASGLSLASYAQGILIGFEAGATNTGAMTLNVDSIGAKSVKLVDGSDPAAGAVTAGGIYLVAYESGTDVLLLLNPTPSGGGISNLAEDTTPQLGGDLDLNGNAITGTGNISITGNLTTTGIDDNATGERLELGDTAALLGDGATAGETYLLGMRGVTSGELRFSSNPASGVGADFNLYGSTHATKAADIEFDAAGATKLQWDHSAGQWEFKQPVVIDLGDLSLAAGYAININSRQVVGESSGTITLSEIDTLDATTEATIESAIDTLPNLTAAASLVTVGTLTTGNADAIVSAAGTTTAGKVELATAAETTTGTDAARAITPDALAGSEYGIRLVQIIVFDDSEDCAVADGAGDVWIAIPTELDGWNLVSVGASVQTAGTTGTLDVQIHNIDNALDMLSTKITIDSGETDSATAATAAVINSSNDHVNEGDRIRVDVDAVQTTAAKGLIVRMGFQKP